MARTATKTKQQEQQALTNKGALTLASSEHALVDLFFIAGASRGKDLTGKYAQLHADMPVELAQLMFWTRDVRGGSGERDTFRSYLQWLATNHPFDAVKVIGLVPEYGRWDDLEAMLYDSHDGVVRQAALAAIETALKAKNGLCAKWMSRKGYPFHVVRKHMGLGPKEYRKLLVGLSNTVEQKMCSKQWEMINFSHVPSVASARYQKAFFKWCKERYTEYREALKTGKPMKDGTVAKINASAIFPHDVLRALDKGDASVANSQWDALPDFMGGNSAFPIVDTSGSMQFSVGGSMTGWVVAVGLGLYVAQRNKGPYENLLMVFSGDAKVLRPNGTIKEKLRFMQANCPVSNTNVQAAFNKLLEIAVANKVAQSDLPKTLLVMSDMEFDQASGCNSKTNFEEARAKFESAGYTLPNVVWWNMNGRAGNVPVKFNQAGVGLISGYSPAILKQVLSGEMSPMNMVNKAVIENKRYEAVAIAMSRTA